MENFKLISIVFLCSIFGNAQAQIPSHLLDYKKTYTQDPRGTNLRWFEDSRFGLFVHYGLYSIPAKGEWIQLLDTIPVEEYEKLQHEFTAFGFDANVIAKVAKRTGMKYITFTAKHHDGFCLFNTATTEFNSVNSPAKRDLVAEMAAACSKHGLGLFLYYSLAADWRHPYFYPREEGWSNARPAYLKKPTSYKYREKDDFRKYIDDVHEQLSELLTRHPSIAGVWFDPIMGYYARPDLFSIDETYSLIRRLVPHALISFKQGANGDEDFVAPERGSGAKVGERFEIARRVQQLNSGKAKEVYNTMQPHLKGFHGGSTWGYNKAIDGHHLKAEDIKKLLQHAHANNYNLLLNIGPLPDGSIHPEDLSAFKALRKIKKSE